MTTTTIHYRYEVGTQDGKSASMVYDNFSKIQDARRCAERLSKEDGVKVFVFDLMARIGQPELWVMTDTGLKVERVRTNTKGS